MRLPGEVNYIEFRESHGQVYFLIGDDDEVVYVGQTTELRHRVCVHRRHKVFSRVLYIDVPMSEIDKVERFWIENLTPKYNYDNQRNGGKPLYGHKYADDIEDQLAALQGVADSILTLGLSKRTERYLVTAGIKTVRDVMACWPTNIYVPGIGDKAYTEIEVALAPYLAQQ